MRWRFRLGLSAALLLVTWSAFAYGPGSVLLMGGGDDTRSWADPAWEWFVAAADSGIIINIDADPIADGYADTFIDFGADPASHGLRITAAMANDPAVFDELITASGIFMEGGDQWEYVEAWNGTLVEEALLQIFNDGGVLGGTSAGMAVLSEVVFSAENGTVYPDEASFDCNHPAIALRDDVFPGVLPGTLADSHFMERGRLGRLLPFLAIRMDQHQEALTGIGVDSYSAFAIDPDGVGTVFGASVTIVQPTPETSAIAVSGVPAYRRALFHQLLYGARYDLATGTLVDPGSWLEPVTPAENPGSGYSEAVFELGDPTISSAGDWRVNGLTGDDLNWWYGDLSLSAADGTIPHTIVLPDLYDDLDYLPNRLVGGTLAIAEHPGITAVYTEHDGSVNEVLFATDEDGYIISGGFLLLITSGAATHTGFSDTYSAEDLPGVVNAAVHLLPAGHQYNLIEWTGVEEDTPRGRLPEDFELAPVYPNPFNGQASAVVHLEGPATLRVGVFDVLGRRVEGYTLHAEAGRHRLALSAEDLASGRYTLSLHDGRHRAIQPFTVIR